MSPWQGRRWEVMIFPADEEGRRRHEDDEKGSVDGII
jgi:hypothetical protein